MIGQLLRDLRQPEYVHTLLNPLSIYGLGVALSALLLALFLRNRPAQGIALALIFICALAVWPVVYFGERAYDNILTMADEDGRAWLDEHEERAETLMYLFYALAAVSAAALVVPIKWPRAAFPLAVATALLAIGALGAGTNIAHSGGKVRHREFRTIPPPGNDKSER